MVMGVALRLCNCLNVVLFDLPEVILVGFVRCLSNALAIALSELWILLLKVILRLGSVEVGSLLLRDLRCSSRCFGYVYCPMVYSHGLSIYFVCVRLCFGLFCG